jgi:outer membrane protein OmpA-like peptidoglycan-associated protein
VEGIGPKIAGLLRAEGIDSFAALSRRSPDEIRAILDKAGSGYEMAEPASWPLQAELLRDGRISDFLALCVALRGGAPRLEDIFGIGEVTGDELRRIGIASPEALAATDAKILASRLGRSVPGLTEQRSEFWIKQAAALRDGDRATFIDLAGIRLSVDESFSETTSNERQTVKDNSTQIPGHHSPRGPLRTHLTDCFLCTAVPASLLVTLALIFGDKPPPPLGCPAGTQCRIPPPECLASRVFTKKFPAATVFDYDKAGLTDTGLRRLDLFTKEVRSRATEYKMEPTVVVAVGHTDRFGSKRYNQILSERRAHAVADVLAKQIGGDADLFHAYGAGEEHGDKLASTLTNCQFQTRPTKDDKLCHAPDRRVEVTVVF